MAVDLTVLGSAGTHTGPGLACSGYLLRAGGTALLLDCGNGSSANLQRYLPVDRLDAIVVTHQHVDHCADLIGMYYALRFRDGGPVTIPLYAAPGVVDVLTGLLSGDSAMTFGEVFDVREVDAGDRVDVGPLRLELFRSAHPVPTVSVRAVADGTVLAYSSDSAGDDELVRCARDADLFVCEATWQGDADAYPDGIHLTAREAGRIATAAGARRLLLTHVLGSADRAVSLAEARETYGGPLAVAADNQTWSLP